MEITPAVLSNLHSTCREKLQEKNEICENILCSDVFLTLCEKVPNFCQNCFRTVVQSAFNVSKKNKNILSLTLMLSFLSDQKAKTFHFFCKEFSPWLFFHVSNGTI